jgi:hypothetical protein
MRKFLIKLFGFKDAIVYKGWLTARVRKSPGDPWKELWTIPAKNCIVNNGLAHMALLWGDAAGLAYTKGAIGTGTTAAVITNTALETQVDIQTGAFSRITTTVTNDTVKLVTTHTAPAGGWAITEYAAKVSDASEIYNRVVFAAINLAEGNQLEFSYESQMIRAT